MLIAQRRSQEIDRTEAFREFARQRAHGAVYSPPLHLGKDERRLHIRSTLREDHQFRIHNRPEGAQAKFDKLASSPFKFFRGTALLFYRDYAGMDADMPVVFTVGDIHPENFGVMPNDDGAPFFGVNDFDEACFAPFTYDIKRGAVGFFLAAKENGLKKKKCCKVVASWVHGYIEGLKLFAQDDREQWFEYRIDNSPDMIRELLEESMENRREFLAEIVDLEKERFKPTDEIVPHSKHIKMFQTAVNEYRKEVAIHTWNAKKDFFQVKDVAIKKDSGTASLGLDRYFVLINGPSDDPGDNLILEFKQSRRSALRGLVPFLEESDTFKNDGAAEHIVKAHDIHVSGGDPFYGQAEIDGVAFMVRERSPYKEEMDTDDLDYGELVEYARICGEVLALTHARSDEDTGIMDGNMERTILEVIDPDLFSDDIVRFARRASKRINQDFELFKADHALHAFNFFGGE